MGTLVCVFYALCIFTPILGNTNVTQVVQPTWNLDQLIARTAALETRLNEEIAKREALEKEVQSKNDLTEFLRRDVLNMNKSLSQEKQQWTQFGTTLSQLENKVENLKSTFAESSGKFKLLSLSSPPPFFLSHGAYRSLDLYQSVKWSIFSEKIVQKKKTPH